MTPRIEPRRDYAAASSSKLPTGVDALPDGVTHCTVDGQNGYSGDGSRCWPYDPTRGDSAMQAALANARQDVPVTWPAEKLTPGGVSPAQRQNATSEGKRSYSEQPFVDLAADAGRISIDDVPGWERAFADDPAEAARQLVEHKPNEDIARMNAAGIGLDEHYRSEAAARLMLDKSEIL